MYISLSSNKYRTELTHRPEWIRANDVSSRKLAFRTAGRDWTASKAVNVSSSLSPMCAGGLAMGVGDKNMYETKILNTGFA